MSKFKVIDGANVVSIETKNREVRALKTKIESLKPPSNKDLIVFSYHFLRLGQKLSAQKYLCKLSDDYFKIGIYKDLFGALLSWALIQNSPKSQITSTSRDYEFFIVVKRSLELFEEVDFPYKAQFYAFKKEFQKYSYNLT